MFRTRRLVLFVALWLTLGQISAFAQVAAVPQLMNFQGRLTKPDGTPVADGTYSVRFRLYDALTGGAVKLEQTVSNIAVRNGTFAVTLSGFAAGTFQSNLWLGIKIGTAAELAPRQPLVTVPYAFKADSVKDGAIIRASITNGTITADKFATGIFNPLVWLLSGNSGAVGRFLGTTDNQPLVFKVNGRQAMRYSYAENISQTGSEYRSVNVLGGSEINSIAAGVLGATIAGGGWDYFTDTDIPNQVTENFGTIGGGFGNMVSAKNATIGGGNHNTASGDSATVVGGGANTASGNYAMVGGGLGNTASGFNTTVGGGNNNSANGNNATVGGGDNNTAGGNAATVGGGDINSASGFAATVAGGSDNDASGDYSFASGRRAKALHTGAFVWGDSTFDNIASTSINQFVIRAGGGVKLAPGTTLEFGFGVAGKDGNAGQMGYGTFTANTLDIVGAGTSFTNRKVKIWAEGGTTFTGNINVNGTNYTSDARYKQNIATLENPLDTLLKLRGVRFEWDREQWKERGFAAGRQIGFIAQEVEPFLPEIVHTDGKGYKSVAYANVVPVLVEAIKQQQRQITEQHKQIEAKLAQKDAEMQALQKANEAKDIKIGELEARLDAIEKRLRERK